MKKTSPAYVIGFMIVICTLCGAAVSFVQFSMKNTLDANARLARNRTIATAFNLTVERQTGESYDAALASYLIEDTISEGTRLWQFFRAKQAPHDIGFIFSGMAFWDAFSAVIVLSNDFTAIRSLEFIEQKETPGLGARIEEPQFRNQFKGYPIDWTRPADRLIVFGEAARGDGAHRIDAITGATQTSIALERIINSELSAFRRVLDKNNGAGAARPGGKD